MRLSLYEIDDKYLQRDKDYECPICLESESTGVWIIHSGKEGHPLHKECSAWYQKKEECPICRAEVDLNSLSKWHPWSETFSELITQSYYYPVKMLALFISALKITNAAGHYFFKTDLPYSYPFFGFVSSCLLFTDLGNMVKYDTFHDVSVFLVSRSIAATIVPFVFAHFITETPASEQYGIISGACCGFFLIIYHIFLKDTFENTQIFKTAR